MKLIVRSAYLEEMASLALTPDIKVITGVRRSGKAAFPVCIARPRRNTP